MYLKTLLKMTLNGLLFETQVTNKAVQKLLAIWIRNSTNNNNNDGDDDDNNY